MSKCLNLILIFSTGYWYLCASVLIRVVTNNDDDEEVLNNNKTVLITKCLHFYILLVKDYKCKFKYLSDKLMVSKGRTWNSASNDWQIALPQVQHPLQLCNMIFIWLRRKIILVTWISIQIKEYDMMISEQFLKTLINKESNLMSFVAENKITKSRNKSNKGDNSWPHQPWCNEMRHFMLEILFNALQETTFSEPF